MKFTIVLLSLAATVLGHGGVVGYKINGQYIKGYMPYNTPTGQVTIQRQWDNFNPIENPTLPSMVCNTPGTPSSHQVSVPAGSRITAYWNTYTHDVGPMVVWMVECPTSCTTWNGRGGKWFKIEEAGLLSGTVSKGKWAVGRMIQQNHTWTFGVPSKLKPGNYLLRTETIAMHAQNPQWYPNCAQIKVMGSGTASPPASYRASIPGVYTLTDPAWSKPIWAGEQASKSTFKIPGPPVWT